MIVGGLIALGVATWMFGCTAVALDAASTAAVEVLPAT
jgi:hypothetical protein